MSVFTTKIFYASNRSAKWVVLWAVCSTWHATVTVGAYQVSPEIVTTAINTTAIITTTPMPTLCPIPPCPVTRNTYLQPQSGPNRNNQQMGSIITISGVFFPEDCTKGCLFSPPCETCEMEVTYFIYFGTEDAGCNFQDSAATACQCTPLSGQVIFCIAWRQYFLCKQWNDC
jgi:hypothetical protein